MAELGKCWEREELGGNQYRQTFSIKPIAYDDNGTFRRINSEWKPIGDGLFGVDEAQFRVTVAKGGTRRIYPLRDERYIEIASPRTFDGLSWNDLKPNPLTPNNNILRGDRVNTGVEITHGGHFIGWDMELKNRPLLGRWIPYNNLLAFPIELHGLEL